MQHCEFVFLRRNVEIDDAAISQALQNVFNRENVPSITAVPSLIDEQENEYGYWVVVSEKPMSPDETWSEFLAWIADDILMPKRLLDRPQITQA